MDVMFYEVFREEEDALRSFLPDTINALFTAKTIQESGDQDLPATLISIRTQSRVPPAWASAGLKGVLTRSAGYDHLLAFRRDIGKKLPCGYLPDYCSRAVAEQAILMMMALLRKLRAQTRNFFSFERDHLTGDECLGKNLLVIGVGRIGSQIVDLGRGLRMNVRGVDTEKRLSDLEYVGLLDGLRWANAAICALPLTPQTRGFLNYETLKQAKILNVFINIARGEVSPIEDLKRLLDEQTICSLGMDVYENEGVLGEALRSGSSVKDRTGRIIQELAGRDNVLFTPHNAFNTHESVERKADLSMKAVMFFLDNGIFPDPIPDE